MQRPYVICHMMMSIDGKVTGGFLADAVCAPATEIYYQINRDYAADAYACGRVTMEEGFTGGWYPELGKYAPAWQTGERPRDFIADEPGKFYAAAFDPHGRLGWQGSRIVDEDPGYGGAHIIEVLTEQADPRYVRYLREQGVSYIFAGECELDMALALGKLRQSFGIAKLLLEGGSILDGAFLRAGLVDELSLVVAPVLADASGKPLFMDGVPALFELAEVKNLPGGLWLNYRRVSK